MKGVRVQKNFIMALRLTRGGGGRYIHTYKHKLYISYYVCKTDNK